MENMEFEKVDIVIKAVSILTKGMIYRFLKLVYEESIPRYTMLKTCR